MTERVILGHPFAEANEQYFWSQVDTVDEDGCWLWTGGSYGQKITKDGTKTYGGFWFAGKNRGAHRIAYELVKGPVPPGMIVRHGPCKEPRCVNPAHLCVGTRSQAQEDGHRGWFRHGIENIPLTEAERQGIRAFRPLCENVADNSWCPPWSTLSASKELPKSDPEASMELPVWFVALMVSMAGTSATASPSLVSVDN